MTDAQLSFNFGHDSDSTQEFFAIKRSWSASKHRIMLRYIQAHCYNLGGNKIFQSRNINYVDGFAGEGKYDKGFGIEDFVGASTFWKRYNINLLDTDGSPLIALKCARAFQQENRVNLRCFFAEAKKQTNQKLRENCEAVGKGLDYRVYPPHSFEKTFPQIMSELNGYPTVVFLDAFGVKGVSFGQICTIGDYLSQHKGELFLLFHNSAVARHAGYLDVNSTNPTMLKAAHTYMKNLTMLLGTNSDQDWKPKWGELRELPQQFERWALRYFVDRIARESRFKGVATYEIKEKYTDTRPMYSIVVCSNHPPKAFGEFLNDFFADENRLLYFVEDKNSLLRNFLEAEWRRQVEDRKVEIESEIIEVLKEISKRWIKLDDLITKIILEISCRGRELGFLKRSNYREILIELYKKNIIEAETLGKNKLPTLQNRVKIVS